MLAQYKGYTSVQRRSMRETAARKAVRSGERSKTLLYAGTVGRIRASADAHLSTDWRYPSVQFGPSLTELNSQSTLTSSSRSTGAVIAVKVYCPATPPNSPGVFHNLVRRRAIGTR